MDQSAVTDPRRDASRDVVAFIKTHVLNDETAAVGEHDELIGQGLIDSMGIVRLMVHLQKLYGIAAFDKADLTLDNFRTPRRIAEMVARYQSVC